MTKKKIGRPNEERRAKQLLDRIAKKKAAKTQPAQQEVSQAPGR